MAEEVKIVDVAGGPAAEATLQELLKVMKGSAGGSGGGGSSDADPWRFWLCQGIPRGTLLARSAADAHRTHFPGDDLQFRV